MFLLYGMAYTPERERETEKGELGERQIERGRKGQTDRRNRGRDSGRERERETEGVGGLERNLLIAF